MNRNFEQVLLINVFIQVWKAHMSKKVQSKTRSVENNFICHFPKLRNRNGWKWNMNHNIQKFTNCDKICTYQKKSIKNFKKKILSLQIDQVEMPTAQSVSKKSLSTKNTQRCLLDFNGRELVLSTLNKHLSKAQIILQINFYSFILKKFTFGSKSSKYLKKYCM